LPVIAAVNRCATQNHTTRNRATEFHPHAYFQLQFGWVFEPLKVSCFTFVPSASMVQIWSLPER
jgi:hypothetical protein